MFPWSSIRPDPLLFVLSFGGGGKLPPAGVEYEVPDVATKLHSWQNFITNSKSFGAYATGWLGSADLPTTFTQALHLVLFVLLSGLGSPGNILSIALQYVLCTWPPSNL